jgi:hypothetical protein
MAVTPEERAAFGWLGRIPPEIINGSREVVERYKQLAKDADKVARARISKESKIAKAKRIEDRYYALLEEARSQLNRRNNKEI